MNNLTAFSTWRSNTLETFENLRTKAILASFIAWILGKNTRLKEFTKIAPKPTSMRVYLGEREISVSQIIGSVGREKDFDNNFRPLKKHLRDRWISIYAMFETSQVPPIQVFKVGNDYYVEDGHHRVSVARAIGQLSMRAKIWEVPPKTKAKEHIPCKPMPGKCCDPMMPAWRTKGEVL